MFGEMLQKLMTEKKIKGKELSILADVTEGYISDLRNGRALPRLKNLFSIIDALHLSENEKNALIEIWERESSPETFVKKFDKLKEKVDEYEVLKESLSHDDKNLYEQLKTQRSINLKLEKERNECFMYKQLFDMIPTEEKKFLLKTILRSIEGEAKDRGVYQENKKEIEKIKKEVEKIL